MQLGVPLSLRRPSMTSPKHVRPMSCGPPKTPGLVLPSVVPCLRQSAHDDHSKDIRLVAAFASMRDMRRPIDMKNQINTTVI